jgi:branched-chain amino acid transport system substrate-binding protein
MREQMSRNTGNAVFAISAEREMKVRTISRVLGSLLMLLCFLIMGLCLFGGSLAIAADTIKLGHVCSITGWAGMLGSAQRDAMLAMVDDINRKGGLIGKQVEVFIEDDQSSPTTALIAATKLIRDRKVNALIAATLSDCAMAILPIAEQEQTPYIVTSPAIIPFKKWVFPVGPGDIKMAAHAMELAAHTLGAKRIALLHDTNLYGTTGARILNRELPKYAGVSFIVTEKYDVKDTNMIPQLTKIKAANPDLLIVYGTGVGAAIVAKNYKQLGMTLPVLGSGGLGSPDFVKVGGPIAEESGWTIMVLKISVAESLPQNDAYRTSVYEPQKKIFQDKYGKDKTLSVFHVSPMDAVTMITLAIKAAGSDNKSSIRDALERAKFDGLLGNVAPNATDHQEDARDTSVLAVLKNGNFIPYTKR